MRLKAESLSLLPAIATVHSMPAIFWIDPALHVGWIWERDEAILRPVSFFALPNGKTILLSDVFAKLDRDLELTAHPS